jgi:transcriptional regulator with GAF, ATPase, and Fis domain
MARRRHITYCNRRASLTAYRQTPFLAGLWSKQEAPPRVGAAQQLGMTARQFSYRWQKLGLPND